MKALSWTLEILPESSSKAAGLRRLLDALGIRPGHSLTLTLALTLTLTLALALTLTL